MRFSWRRVWRWLSFGSSRRAVRYNFTYISYALAVSIIMVHRPDDGSSKYLWIVRKLLPYYTAQQNKSRAHRYCLSPTVVVFNEDSDCKMMKNGLMLYVEIVIKSIAIFIRSAWSASRGASQYHRQLSICLAHLINLHPACKPDPLQMVLSHTAFCMGLAILIGPC
jgi:hypothetical protein